MDNGIFWTTEYFGPVAYPTSKNTIGVQAVTDRSPTSWQQQTTDARPNWPIILEVTSCSRETVKVQHTTKNVVLNWLVDVDEDARSLFPKDVLLRWLVPSGEKALPTQTSAGCRRDLQWSMLVSCTPFIPPLTIKPPLTISITDCFK